MQLHTVLIGVLIFIVLAVMGIIVFLPTQTPEAPMIPVLSTETQVDPALQPRQPGKPITAPVPNKPK